MRRGSPRLCLPAVAREDISRNKVRSPVSISASRRRMSAASPISTSPIIQTTRKPPLVAAESRPNSRSLSLRVTCRNSFSREHSAPCHISG